MLEIRFKVLFWGCLIPRVDCINQKVSLITIDKCQITLIEKRNVQKSNLISSRHFDFLMDFLIKKLNLQFASQGK